jgi:hypothetical protein
MVLWIPIDAMLCMRAVPMLWHTSLFLRLWHGGVVFLLSPCCLVVSVAFYGQIDLNIEVCISNSHVYGTVTLAVNVTVSIGASHLQGNRLPLVVRRNQRPNDFPNGEL